MSLEHAARYMKTVRDSLILCLLPYLLTDASNIDSMDPNLEANTKHFHGLLLGLSTRVQEFDPIQAPQSPDQKRQQEDRERLRNLASNLLQDTQNLERILQKASKATAKWKLVITAIKYRVHYKRIIADLEKNIQSAHGILNTEFLTRIW